MKVKQLRDFARSSDKPIQVNDDLRVEYEQVNGHYKDVNLFYKGAVLWVVKSVDDEALLEDSLFGTNEALTKNKKNVLRILEDVTASQTATPVNTPNVVHETTSVELIRSQHEIDASYQRGRADAFEFLIETAKSININK